jgi:hypothetical protein
MVTALALVVARALACSNDYSSANAPPPDAATPETGRHNPGDEGEVCFPNHTCNDALACLSDRCVRLGGPPDSGSDGSHPQTDASTGPDACASGNCGIVCGPNFVVDEGRNLAFDKLHGTTFLITPFLNSTWDAAVAQCGTLGSEWSLPDAFPLSQAIGDDSTSCAFAHPEQSADWSTFAAGNGTHYTVAPNGNFTAEVDSTKRSARCTWKQPPP